MMKRIMCMVGVLLTGFVLFVSCGKKYGGLPVEDDTVKVTVSFGEESEVVAIPESIYAVMEDNFSMVSVQFNKDAVLSEDIISSYDEFSNNLYSVSFSKLNDDKEAFIEELKRIVLPEDVNEVMSYLVKLSEEELNQLEATLGLCSELLDMPIDVLEEFYDQSNDEGYYENHEDFFADLRESEEMKAFYTIVAQIFPGVEFIAK